MTDERSLFTGPENPHLAESPAPRTSDPHPDVVPVSSTIVDEPAEQPSYPVTAPRGDYVPAVIPEAVKRTEEVGALIRFALERGTDPAGIRELVLLQEHVMDRQAKATFEAAKRALQSECPEIRKNKSYKLSDDSDPIRYADLPSIKRVIRPLMDKYGFTDAYKQKLSGGVATVTCILTHAAGHSEEYSFDCESAQSGKMSAMQKAGSATTFAQRYALRGALGLQIGDDDDGRLPPQATGVDTERDETQPKTKPRGERQQRQQQPKPEITGDEVKAIFNGWKEAIAGGQGTPALFVEWVAKKLENPPALNPSDTASWRSVLTKADLEALRKELP